MRTSTEISKRPDKRPRGRPRSFTTPEVLDRVRAVFMAKGFAAASLDELAEAAELNRPSLYAAFGDKEQLYIHALRFYGERSVAGLEAILGGKGTIDQRLGKVYKAAIELYTPSPGTSCHSCGRTPAALLRAMARRADLSQRERFCAGPLSASFFVCCIGPDARDPHLAPLAGRGRRAQRRGG